MLKDLFNKKSKLVINVTDNIERYCPRDYRVTVSSIAYDAQKFIKDYLSEPNNGYLKDELSVSLTISDGYKTLFTLTALQYRETMETKNIYVNKLSYNFAKGKYPITVRIGVYVRNRNRGTDRAYQLYEAIERVLTRKYGKNNA